MSSTTPAAGQSPTNENRRKHARRRFDQLSYATFGTENGGILIDMSEEGMCFHGFRVVDKDQPISVSFKLPGLDTPIEISAAVIWTNESGKGGGLRFADLDEETRQLIKQWSANDPSSAGMSIGQVATHPGTAGTLRAPERNPVQSPPRIDEKGQQESTWVRAKPSTREPWRISAQAPPHSPGKTRESEAQSARKRRYVLFAVGVLVGCIVILAAIAVIRVLGSADRPTTPAEAQTPAEQRTAGPGSLDSTVDGIDLKDGRSPLATPATGQNLISKTSRGEIAGLAASEAKSESPQKSPPQETTPPPPSHWQWTSFFTDFFSNSEGNAKIAIDRNQGVVQVWTSKSSGYYYCSSSPYYQTLKPGVFMSQGEALQSGYQPKLGQPCN